MVTHDDLIEIPTQAEWNERLRERRLREAPNRSGKREYRSGMDAWFSLWTIPAQAWLYWLREMTRHAGGRP
jgi:hypothetical protein